MRLEFDSDRLLQLMKDFHILTGIRIVLFDDEYQELLSYPEKDCTFCRQMKSSSAGQKKCRESDAYSFRQCNLDQRLIIYHCHAGLIEATAPLIDNHIFIGYLMFGQISDAASTEELKGILSKIPAGDKFLSSENIFPKSIQSITFRKDFCNLTHFSVLPFVCT